jgi:hypothetical protein
MTAPIRLDVVPDDFLRCPDEDCGRAEPFREDYVPYNEISRECHDRRHGDCQQFAGDYDTWVCQCRCHEPVGRPGG